MSANPSVQIDSDMNGDPNSFVDSIKPKPKSSTIPSSSAAAGGNSQGALIRTAPHNITEDNPFQVEADILFRNLKIDVQDAEHYYP